MESNKNSNNPPNNFKVKDRRFWNKEPLATDTVGSEEGATTASSKLPTFLEQLQSKLLGKDEEVQRLADALRLQREEQRRIRERMEREQNSVLLNLKVELFAPLLEIVDNLERCEKSAPVPTQEGIRLILSQFSKTLETLGVKKLQLAGKAYNPDQAEAIATEQVNDPAMDNIILEEYRSGCTIEDRLIRPARVRVAQYVKTNSVETVTEGDVDASTGAANRS